MEKSISVKAQVPTWVRLDEPVWTSENPHSLLSWPSCLPSMDLPSPTRILMFHQPLPIDPMIQQPLQSHGFSCMISFNLKRSDCCHLYLPLSCRCPVSVIDWQILKGTGRKASPCASTYWVPKERKKALAEGCTAPVNSQPQYISLSSSRYVFQKCLI